MNDKLKTVLLENYKSWKSESSFFTWLRGGIRRGLWNRSPIKINYISNHRVKIKNPNPNGRVKEVWGGECALCNNVFVLSELQVDHKRGDNKLSSIDDIQKFIESIVVVENNDLQMVCKQCHNIKSYAEKHNVSLREAKIIKNVIQLIKDKEDKEYLIQHNITPTTNQAGRREQLIDYMLNKETK